LQRPSNLTINPSSKKREDEPSRIKLGPDQCFFWNFWFRAKVATCAISGANQWLPAILFKENCSGYS